ncbi:DUF6907 domain-containing protein [Streptomyces violaceusniger]|uniref:DUF6907 domain-containing protein n=1 Tax=Streptomyces violaceusniger TaxID=68280 RepID=UPI0036A5B5F1
MSDRTDVRHEDARTINPAALSSEKVRAQLAGIPQRPTTEAADRPGKVTFFVRGVPVTVDEPEWCTGHSNLNVSNLSDIVHFGSSVEVPVPQPNGTAMPGMEVYLMQWPFAEPGGNSKPFMAVVDDETSEIAALDSVAGLAHADRLRAYADEVERKARHLAVYEAALKNGAQS